MTEKPPSRLSLLELNAMDRDIIRDLAKQRRFKRVACYRIGAEDATLILDTGDDNDREWPAKITNSGYYYTLKNKPQLTFGWQDTPESVTSQFPALKSTRSYLPPQDPWGTKFVFIVKKEGRSNAKNGDLDGFMEVLGRRFHFWIASDELRHFIDDTTSQEQLHAFGAMLSRMVGHEMRNPITNLLSLAQTHSLLWRDSSTEVSQFADEVERYAQHIWDVVQKLEVLAINGDDRLNPRDPPTQINFREIVESTLARELSNQDANSAAKVHISISDGNYMVHGVPSLVKLAVREVFHNAFSYGQGTPIKVALYIAGGNLILDIADEGPSISPGQEELIFMRYFQGPKAVNQKSSIRRGLGLGLYLARFVTTIHNSQLLFVRGVGKKGAFRFIWPLSQPTSKAS